MNFGHNKVIRFGGNTGLLPREELVGTGENTHCLFPIIGEGSHVWRFCEKKLLDISLM